MPENELVCSKCGKHNPYYYLYHKHEPYCQECFIKLVEKMKRKELQEAKWEIEDRHENSTSYPSYKEEDWKLISRRLFIKEAKRFRWIELITVFGIVITAIAVVLALFKA